MSWTTTSKLLTLRNRSSVVDVIIVTIEGFQRHRSGRNAALLTYYGFLTIFPLFLVGTTVLGWVLEGNAQLRQDIIDSAASQIPIIGDSLTEPDALNGNTWALIIGLLGATWAATKAFVGIQLAFDDAWEVPKSERANPVVARLRALIGMLVIGLAQVGSVAVTTIAAEARLPQVGRVLLVVGVLVLNFVVVGSMYRFLTAEDVTKAMVWPGALFSAVFYTILQIVGTLVVARSIANAESVYGDLATTLALMAWLSLHATVSLYGAELNAAIRSRKSGALHRNLGYVPVPDFAD